MSTQEGTWPAPSWWFSGAALLRLMFGMALNRFFPDHVSPLLTVLVQGTAPDGSAGDELDSP